MSDCAEIVLTFSVLTCQPDQFMSDSAENSATFRHIKVMIWSWNITLMVEIAEVRTFILIKALRVMLTYSAG